MNRPEILRRFNTLYLGDSVLQQVILETGGAQCLLRFNVGKVLKGEGASIFDPEAGFEPALLRLHDVKSVEFRGGAYQLNSTVVDFGASPSEDSDYIEFAFELTGGIDPKSFMVEFRVIARNFEIGTVDPEAL